MTRSRGSRDTEKAFTERAIEATEKFCAQNKLVSPVVYVPRTLRSHQYRLTVDDLKITMTPEEIGENHLRIAKADPLGLIIAAINGQPIPEFVVQEDGSLRVNYTTLPLEDRLELAVRLMHKITHRIPKELMIKGSPIRAGHVEYDNMIQKAVDAIQETAEED